MSEMDFEHQLQALAKKTTYPRTPDIAGRVMPRIVPVTKPRVSSRRVAWSLTLIVVLLFSVMLIPPVRAAVIEFIQIGIVRIFPRPTELPIETATATTPLTATPYLESSTLLVDLSKLAGERTLSQAQSLVASEYQILLPTYPPDLGAPDHIFVQDADGEMTIFVWLDPQNSEKVLLSLHFIPEGSWVIRKSEPVTIQETLVNGRRAVWAAGPYPLRYSNGNLEFARLIDGFVLIWAEGDVTYRLETALPMEEAVKIAESLQPVP